MASSRFVYVTYIRTTPEKLWQALLEPEFTRQYWGETWQDCTWEVGASWKLMGQRTKPAVRAAALVAGVLAAAFVAVGYAAPSLVAGLWPWELTPLTTRAFLSWVGAFAGGTDRRELAQGPGCPPDSSGGDGA